MCHVFVSCSGTEWCLRRGPPILPGCCYVDGCIYLVSGVLFHSVGSPARLPKTGFIDILQVSQIIRGCFWLKVSTVLSRIVVQGDSKA